MRQQSEKWRRRSVISPTAVGAATCGFLRARHPSRTAFEVAADLSAFGIKAQTVAKMLERESTPSTILWIALTCTYGPEFLHAVLEHPPRWLDAAWRAERQNAYRREMDALERRYEDCK